MKYANILLISALGLSAAKALAQNAQTATQNGQTVTHIMGELEDNTIDELILHRVDVIAKVEGRIEVPFRNGRFSYDLRTDGTEAYDLSAMKDNVGDYVNFFTEGDTVRIKFYVDKGPEWHAGTPLNKELLWVSEEKYRLIQPIEEEALKMEKEGRDLTPEARELKARRDKAFDEDNETELRAIAEEAERLEKEGRFETPEYMALNKKAEELYRQIRRAEVDYVRSHPTPVGLLYLYKMAMNSDRPEATVKAKEVADIYRAHFAGKLPDFHLTETMRIFCEAQEVRPGGRYYDFTLPDLDGTMHRLSDEIKGKVALIDLWASWCAPCRRTSMSMIPVYEEYKDKGFTVVGVARESEAEDMRRAVKKDKYPWLNLLELKDSTKLWQHYGVNAAGCTFLVDRDGKILAISPTADEVRATLEKLLK